MCIAFLIFSVFLFHSLGQGHCRRLPWEAFFSEASPLDTVRSVSMLVTKRHDSRVCLCLDISDFCLWPGVHPVTMSAIVEPLKERAHGY